MKKWLWIFVGVQLLAIVLAVIAFAVLDNPKVAGQLTGPLFLLSGALPLLAGLFGLVPLKSPPALASLVMTLCFSGPMLLLRYTAMGSDFESLSFFGIPAALFHRLSGAMFLILIAAELFQIFRHKKTQA